MARESKSPLNLVNLLLWSFVGSLAVGWAPAWAQAAAGAEVSLVGGDIVEEDLDLEVQAKMEEAEALFQSADQPESIPLFSGVISVLRMRAEAGEASPSDAELLQRCQFLRAEAHFNDGSREAAAADLESVLRVDPGFVADQALVSPKLIDLLERLRSRLVGTLVLTLEPFDAEVRVDDREVTGPTNRVPVLSGPHRLVVTRPGFSSFDLELEVLAGEDSPLDVLLVRESAVVRVATRPSGAEILFEDRVRATTKPRSHAAEAEALSEPAAVEGLQAGERILEIRKPGYRSVKLRVEVLELTDYSLAPVRLEPTRGTVILESVPGASELSVDGSHMAARPDASGIVEISLPPGEHRIHVAAGARGVFETTVLVVDQERIELEVDLRPSIVVLGALGGDRQLAMEVHETLLGALEDVQAWTILDRGRQGLDLVGELGLDAQLLRAIAAREVMPDAEPDWRQLRETLDSRVSGSLYFLAVLSDDLYATHADIWLWPSAPGPARPAIERVALRESDPLARLEEILETPPKREISWLGARLIDLLDTDGPLVLSVSPGGPAAAAGIKAGDRISSIAGQNIGSRFEALAATALASPGDQVEMKVGAGGSRRSVSVTLGASPSVMALNDPDLIGPILSAALESRIARAGGAEDEWVLRFNQAMLHMRAGDWPESVRLLRAVRAPAGAGLGQAAVDYWLAVALLEADRASYAETSRELLERAAQDVTGRLFHHDGPLVAPRARARLRTLGTP